MTCQHIFPRLLVKKFKFTLGIMYENMVYIKINHTNKYRNPIWLKVMKGALEKILWTDIQTYSMSSPLYDLIKIQGFKIRSLTYCLNLNDFKSSNMSPL